MDPIADRKTRAAKTTNENRTRAVIMLLTNRNARRGNTSYTQLGERVRTIPFPHRNQGGRMGGRVGPPPIIRTVGDKNFSPGLNTARSFQPGRTRSGVHYKTGICFGSFPCSVSRSAYTTEEGSIKKKGVGELETVNAHIFFGVSRLNFLSRKGLTKIIN
jgi:hypothetical protein